jgi:hypothetical protein
MNILANVLPITFLGSFCLLVLIVLAYYSWRRSSPVRRTPSSRTPEYEVEEIPGTTDFVMVGRKGHSKKKVKKPKLCEIWVSGSPTHGRKVSSGSSFSDFSLNKDGGHWAEFKVGVPGSVIP